MTTYYNLEMGTVMTAEEKEEIERARKMPVVYDEDSPELTDEMEKAFIEARRRKPFRGKKVTVFLSDATIEKAEKRFGENYTVALGKMIEKAVASM